MSFVRDGYPVMALSGGVAVVALAASVWRRSWFLWLLGFVLLLLATGVAWSYRTPRGAALPAPVVTLTPASL
jgi:hypothetical protein